MKAILTLVLLLTGCGTEVEIDSTLEPHLNRYLWLAGDNGHLDELVSLKIGEPPAGKNGRCEIETIEVGGKVLERRRTVTIKPLPAGYKNDFWRSIIMHELGHCLHDKEHTDGDFDIMNPERKGNADYWAEHLDGAVKEMLHD